MKNRLILTTLISGAILGLSACGGGGGGGSVFNTFDGVWQGACQATTGNVSFKQELTINGTATTSEIEVFTQPNCPSGATPTLASATGTFDYQGETAVSAVCASGNAEKVNATVTSLAVAGGNPITDPTAIATLLNTLGVSVVPEFNLLCLDANGALRTGDITEPNNGSSDALRPTSMGNDIFTKI